MATTAPKTVRLAIRVRTSDGKSLRFEGTFPLSASLWEIVCNITPVGATTPLVGFETSSNGWYIPVIKHKTSVYNTLELLTSTSVRQLNISSGSALLEGSLAPTGMPKPQAFALADSLRSAYLQRQAEVMNEIANSSPNISSPLGSGAVTLQASNANSQRAASTPTTTSVSASFQNSASIQVVQIRLFRHAIAAVSSSLERLLDDILIDEAAKARLSNGRNNSEEKTSAKKVGEEALQRYKKVLETLRKFLISILDTSRLHMRVPAAYVPSPLDPSSSSEENERILMHPAKARARTVLLLPDDSQNGSDSFDEDLISKISLSEASSASSSLSKWDSILRILSLCGFALVDENRIGSNPITLDDLVALPHPSSLLFVSSPRDASNELNPVSKLLAKRGGHFASHLNAGPGSNEGNAIFPTPFAPLNNDDKDFVNALTEDAKSSGAYVKASRMVLVPELEGNELITRILQEIEEAEIRFPPMNAADAGRRAAQLLRNYLDVQRNMDRLDDRLNELMDSGMEVDNALAVVKSDEDAARDQILDRARNQSQNGLDEANAMDYDINQLKAALDEIKAEIQPVSDENPLTRPVLCSVLTSLVNMAQHVLNKLAARDTVRVDTSKPSFQTKLGRFPATLKVMRFLGFTQASDNPQVQSFTPSEQDKLRVTRAQAIIQAALQQATPSPSETQFAEFLSLPDSQRKMDRGWDPIVYEPREGKTSASEHESKSRGLSSLLGGRFGQNDSSYESQSDAALLMSVIGNKFNQELVSGEGRFLSKAEFEQMEQSKAKIYDTTIIRVEFANQYCVQYAFPPSAPFETIFDALDLILNNRFNSRDYALRIGVKLLTRTRGVVDLTKSKKNWPPEREGRYPYMSFADIRLVPAVHARIQWLDEALETSSTPTPSSNNNPEYDDLSANACLKPEVLARSVPFQEAPVPKAINVNDKSSTPAKASSTPSQAGGSASSASSSSQELSEADLDRLTEQMLSGGASRGTRSSATGTSTTTSGSKPTSTKKLPAWFGRK